MEAFLKKLFAAAATFTLVLSGVAGRVPSCLALPTGQKIDPARAAPLSPADLTLLRDVFNSSDDDWSPPATTAGGPRQANYPASPTQADSSESTLLSLKDAVFLSLENNPDLAITGLGPAAASQSVLSAQSVFDTVIREETFYRHRTDPSESVFTRPSVTETYFDFNLALQQKLQTGAEIGLAWNNKRTSSDSPIILLSPEWRSNLDLTVDQPLLNGTGWGAPGVVVRLNRKLEKAAFLDYQAELANHVQRVISAYWADANTREVLEVRERSLLLANRLEEDMQKSVDVGLLPPLSLSESRAQVALRREELIAAISNWQIAGRRLRGVTGIDYAQDFRDVRPFHASEKPDFFERHFDSEQSITAALEKRPEIKAQELRVKAAVLSGRLAENQTLPVLNLRGAAGLTGLAGTQKEGIQIPGFPERPIRYEGNYGDTLDRLKSGDHYNYGIGVSFEYPLGNHAAKARANQEQINLLREQYSLRGLKQSIIEEVLRALSNLEASKKRVQAAREAVRYSAESVEVARNKLKAGAATVREVLEVQRDLSEAELKQAQALTDFLSNIAEIERSRGELLQSYGISVSD